MKTACCLLVLVCAALFACSGKKANVVVQEQTQISDDSLMTLVQYRTFQYFWDGAEPNSGLARERFHVDGDYPQNDKHIITSGGGGFGVMAILVGIERGFITRMQGLERMERIVTFLENADTFHGVWPHWWNGETGEVKPFGKKDNGGDLVETSFMVQGLLTVRQYFKDGTEQERALAHRIDRLWRAVEFDWHTKGGENVLYWHWSPSYGWEMNFPVTGYNECMIMYVLAASSPTHGVSPDVYHLGWNRSGEIVNDSSHTAFGHHLALRHNGAQQYGGPLFWAHYSYLALNPRGLKDQYADYWEHNRNHTLINRAWCVENPLGFRGYGPESWGLTASYSVNGYAAHAPGEKHDKGVISPTAALSSFPYTPEYSMQAMRHWYENLGDKVFGEYGFYDAFSETDNWFPQRYLAIDQGPTIVMIENHRTGLLWDLFMSCPEVQDGLRKLGLESPYLDRE